MKNFCAVLVGLCAVISSVYAFDRAQAEEMAKEILTICKDSEGGSDDDFNTLIKFDYPTTSVGNCMVACAHEKIGLFNDGKFMKDNFITFAKMATNDDPKYVDLAIEIANKCDNIEGPRCEQAINFNKCLEAEAKAKNIKKLDIL
ncbi:hypothetical protein PVAND_011302 [Polypedilum vanderplanki]|uniref:Odorant binding protein n=1 Tax=Polypedilum vanderplanki TaxID=319348 RepID=A0A9J6CJ16_POLVA|nr:hypothetical protein PVAND_011302 [Polypedilum vanderplanki]